MEYREGKQGEERGLRGDKEGRKEGRQTGTREARNGKRREARGSGVGRDGERVRREE